MYRQNSKFHKHINKTTVLKPLELWYYKQNNPTNNQQQIVLWFSKGLLRSVKMRLSIQWQN